MLVELIGDYHRAHVRPDNPMLIPYENGRPLKRAAVARMLDTITTAAGMPHIHPHKLRHTLAAQAINRGMSMEAIAALLGHHSLDMTRRYARLHDKTLKRAYTAVTDNVDALYAGPTAASGVHHEIRDRLLGNGRCSRPRQLSCDHDLACENCVFFQIATDPQRPHEGDAPAEETRCRWFGSARTSRPGWPIAVPWRGYAVGRCGSTGRTAGVPAVVPGLWRWLHCGLSTGGFFAERHSRAPRAGVSSRPPPSTRRWP